MDKTYVVAVSGGVDSVVLLDMLVSQGDSKLIVAHFDHGMRPDSKSDREFVQQSALKYDLQFVYDEGDLGLKASEATARDARYKFLYKVKNAAGASAIMTAHHEDDVLETAIINLIRGTGRKGLASLRSTGDIIRPLLNMPKSDVKKYAHEHGLEWREDSTNSDTKYLRNYVRHNIVSKFDADSRKRLRKLIDSAGMTNAELDDLIGRQLENQPGANELNRIWFIGLPHDVSREIVASWLRSNSIKDFDRKTIERIVVAAKTFKPGKQIDVDARYNINVYQDILALEPRER